MRKIVNFLKSTNYLFQRSNDARRNILQGLSIFTNVFCVYIIRLSITTGVFENHSEQPDSIPIRFPGSLKNLKILSLGRNYIKSFAGLETLGDTLEELWISYNLIEKLKGVNVLRNLKVLYMSNNLVREWAEVNKLQVLEAPNFQNDFFP